MPNNNIPQTEEDLVRAFADALDELIPEDPEEIEELLQEMGLNRADIRLKTNALIQELAASTPLDWRNRDQDIEKAKAERRRIGSNLPKDRSSLLGILQQLRGQSRAQAILAGVNFRSKSPEEMSDAELQTFVQDLLYALDSTSEDINEE